MTPIPQHPGREQAPQQGLGAPVASSNANPYFVPNQALQGSNGKLQAAQAQQAQAQANKVAMETAVMQQAAAQQGLAPRAPSRVDSLANGIARGELNQEQLAGLVQSGQVSPEEANTAFGLVQASMQQTQPQSGLGTVV